MNGRRELGFLLVNASSSASERSPSSKPWRRFAVGVWRPRRAREPGYDHGSPTTNVIGSSEVGLTLLDE